MCLTVEFKVAAPGLHLLLQWRCRGASVMVASVGSVLLDVLIGEVAAVALIQTLLPTFVTCVVGEGCLEVFPALCTSLLASDRRSKGRDVIGREKDLG